MIRHSTLPKLAECPCYESKLGEAGPAAQRGTKLDGRFRQALATGTLDETHLEKDEIKALKWAIKQVRKIAGGDEIISEESLLKVETPGLKHIGTEDSRIPSKQASCDLKTGIQRSGYFYQMAAYAYGNMESYFCDAWTCYLIYCDQREVVEHKFTLEQARKIVEGVLTSYNDPNKQPSQSQYCSWCAKKDTCPQVVKPALEAHSIMERGQNLAVLRQEIASDPVRLSRFLQINKVFESELVKPLKESAKEQLLAGQEIDGYRISKSDGSEYFDRVAIVSTAIAGKWGMDDLVDALGGTMSGSTFRELCEKYNTVVPEDMAKKKDSIVKMIESKRKTK